jgi:hypothetical protein
MQTSMEFHVGQAAWVRLDTPPQPLEFLAVPLGDAQATVPSGEPVHAVLGTPLYVAHARP